MLATIVLSKENAKGMAKGMVALLGVEGGVDGAGVSQLFRMMASLGRIEMTEAEAEVAAAQFTLRQGRGGRVDQRSLAEGLANTPMLP
jgi:ABC-type phosphate/phosphonate transport system ATPase subunit